MYSFLLSLVTTMSDPLGFRSTWYVWEKRQKHHIKKMQWLNSTERQSALSGSQIRGWRGSRLMRAAGVPVRSYPRRCRTAGPAPWGRSPGSTSRSCSIHCPVGGAASTPSESVRTSGSGHTVCVVTCITQKSWLNACFKQTKWHTGVILYDVKYHSMNIQNVMKCKTQSTIECTMRSGIKRTIQSMIKMYGNVWSNVQWSVIKCTIKYDKMYDSVWCEVLPCTKEVSQHSTYIQNFEKVKAYHRLHVFERDLFAQHHLVKRSDEETWWRHKYTDGISPNGTTGSNSNSRMYAIHSKLNTDSEQ